MAVVEARTTFCDLSLSQNAQELASSLVLFLKFLFQSGCLCVDGTFDEHGNMATRTTRRSFPRPHDDIPKQHEDLFIPSKTHKPKQTPLQIPTTNRLTPSHLTPRTSRPRHYIDCAFLGGRDGSESNQMRQPRREDSAQGKDQGQSGR
jgi:hypothetical protein